MKLKSLFCGLILFCVLLCPLWTQAEWFGHQTKYASGSTDENHQFGTIDDPSLSGTVDSITCYHYAFNGTSHQTRYALYEYHGESDNILIDSTAEFTLTHVFDGWHSQETLLGGSITSGVDYLIVSWSEATSGLNQMFWTGTVEVEGSDYVKTYVGAGWAATESANPFTGRVSIYCTYTVEAEGSSRRNRILRLGARR